MDTRAKGNRARLKVRKMLEDKGWTVAIVENPNKFARERDIFGVGDLLAIKQNVTAFIQVRNARDAHPHIKYINFIRNYGGDNLLMFQYHLKDQQIIIFEYYTWGYYRIIGAECKMVKVSENY